MGWKDKIRTVFQWWTQDLRVVGAPKVRIHVLTFIALRFRPKIKAPNYLLGFMGKIKALDRRGHVAKLCIVLLPLLMASLVGVSCVDDYWHHWQDVFAGGLIGLFIATLSYLQFFPAPYHTEGWGPYAYFRAVEVVRSSRQHVHSTNGGVEVERLEVQLNQQSGTTTNPVEDVEYGRM